LIVSRVVGHTILGVVIGVVIFNGVVIYIRVLKIAVAVVDLYAADVAKLTAAVASDRVS
jgi:hypothetical protein